MNRQQVWILKRAAIFGESSVAFVLKEKQSLSPHITWMKRKNCAIVLQLWIVEKSLRLEQPSELINSLLATGFTKPRTERLATLEDVFLNMTGHSLREEE